MEVYVVTSLYFCQDEDAELNVLGVTKTLEDAIKLRDDVADETIESYEENNFDYEVKEYDDNSKIIKASFDNEDDEDDFDEDYCTVDCAYETIELEIKKMEVK